VESGNYFDVMSAMNDVEGDWYREGNSLLLMMSFTVCWEPGVTHETCFSREPGMHRY